MDTYRCLRYFCRFISGLLFAFLFWLFILYSFSLPSNSQLLILYAFIGLIGFGFICSTSIRCMILLIFVGMIGKSGRSYLRALAFAIIISGPITNLAQNGAEIVRVFACTTALSYNLTKTRFDLITKPFQNTIKAMQGDIRDVQYVFADIKNVLEPLRNEVENEELGPSKESLLNSTNKASIDAYMNYKNETDFTQKNPKPIDYQSTDDKNANMNNQKNENLSIEAQNSTYFNYTYLDHKNNQNSNHIIPTSNNEKRKNATLTENIKHRLSQKKITNNDGDTTFVDRRCNTFICRKRNSEKFSKKYHKRNHYRRQSSSERAAEIQQKYAKKIKRRCKEQLAKGEERCRAVFRKTFDNCNERFPVIIKTILCLPFRVDFVCNFRILGNPDSICDPTEALPNNFGESYQELETAENQLYRDEDIKVSYKMHNLKTQPGLKTANETAEALMSEFRKKKIVFDHVMSIVRIFLSLFFLRVIFSSISYKKNYNNELTFDNLYVSEYFKHVDKRRKLEKKLSVLPLRKYELKDLVDTARSSKQTQDESKDMIFNFLQLSLEIIVAVIFLMLDYFVVTLLIIVRERSAITYTQEGEHIIKFHINGTGLLAKLLRITLRNFNMHEKVNTVLTNEHCLPRANMLPNSFYIKLLTLYIVIMILIYKSSIFLRLRRLVCSYFYRRREKHRILYLFNGILRQRRSLFKAMLKIAQDNVVKRKIRREINLILKLRLCCPKCFNWLKFFKAACRKCLICEEYEDDKFVVCSNPQCYVVYCSDCWRDMGNNCLICNYPIKKIVIQNFDEFFEVYPTKNLVQSKAAGETDAFKSESYKEK